MLFGYTANSCHVVKLYIYGGISPSKFESANKINPRAKVKRPRPSCARRTFTCGCLIYASAWTLFALSNFDGDLLPYTFCVGPCWHGCVRTCEWVCTSVCLSVCLSSLLGGKNRWQDCCINGEYSFTWTQVCCECALAPRQFLAEIHSKVHCWRCSIGVGHSGLHVARESFWLHSPGRPTTRFCCHKYGPGLHPAWLHPRSNPAAC